MQTTADYCISLHITSQTIPNILLNIEVTISMRHHVLFKCLLTWLLTQHNRPSLSNEPKSKLSFNEKNCWFLTPITVVCTLLLLSNYWGFWYILSFMFFFPARHLEWILASTNWQQAWRSWIPHTSFFDFWIHYDENFNLMESSSSFMLL